MVAVRSGSAAGDPGARGDPSRRIDAQAAASCDGAGAKRQRRDMSFANGTETENEAQATFRCVRLIGVRHDAGVEQGRGFERIFVEKISANQLALDVGKGAVSTQCLFHAVGAGLDSLQKVALPAST